MRKRAKAPTVEPEPVAPPVPERYMDANQVVAFNFRVARELRGWTQEEAARRLARYLGQELPKASISAIERSVESDRRRFFNAAELVAFAEAFDLPVVWFLLPPPYALDYRLAGVDIPMSFLARVVLGRDDQLADLQQRLEQIRRYDPEEAGKALADAANFPPELTWAHFERTRQEALFALVEEETSEIERMVGDLRRVLDRFEDLSLKSHFASHPRAVYRAISNSLVGEKVFRKVIRDLEREDLDRFTMVTNAMLSPKATEALIDLDDPELVERLGAVYDRVEERLREKANLRQFRRGAEH